MKNRIIIDFNVDEELSGNDIELLRDDIQFFVETHETFPYVSNVSVTFQDEYCIKNSQ